MDAAHRYGLVSRIWHGALIAFVLGVATIAPNLIFGVKPFATGNAGPSASAGVTSHTPSVPVFVLAEDDLERQVRADVYKWCGFCHTTTQNGEHLLGPNLYGIFGQRAGTTPNFINYSDAMIAARDNGLVWTDETIDAYIHDTQKFMPGTNMVISIGNIEDPAVREKVVNILKRETMGDYVKPAGSEP
jgi:cytochrome c2